MGNGVHGNVERNQHALSESPCVKVLLGRIFAAERGEEERRGGEEGEDDRTNLRRDKAALLSRLGKVEKMQEDEESSIEGVLRRRLVMMSNIEDESNCKTRYVRC